MTNQKTKRIANSINLIAHLPEGDSLVYLLGTGDESNNLDALTSWVDQQSDLLTIEQPHFMIEQLTHRLQNKIHDMNSCCFE